MTRRVTGRVVTGQSRRRAVLAAAAQGMRGRPVAVVAALLGVSERTVERYWSGMADNSLPAVPEVYFADPDPAELERVAHHIAAYAADAEAAAELAGMLGVPRVAFADARAALRQSRFAAPAAEAFTVLHVVARGLAALGVGVTVCGRPMFPDQLWQFIDADDGDPVCVACLGAGDLATLERLVTEWEGPGAEPGPSVS